MGTARVISTGAAITTGRSRGTRWLDLEGMSGVDLVQVISFDITATDPPVHMFTAASGMKFHWGSKFRILRSDVFPAWMDRQDLDALHLALYNILTLFLPFT